LKDQHHEVEQKNRQHDEEARKNTTVPAKSSAHQQVKPGFLKPADKRPSSK
jgi:hypothetical protein